MESGKYVALGIVLTLVVAAAGVFWVAGSSQPAEATPAPPFSVLTVDGETVGTDNAKGSLLLLDFSGIVCDPCRLVEFALRDLYRAYSDRVTFLSVFIGGYGSNDAEAIRSFRASEEGLGRPIPWHLATAAPDMIPNYRITTIPHLFVIDAEGYVVYEWTPTIGVNPEDGARDDIGAALERALAGTAAPISLTALSIPGLLIVAALLSFFSPCSFPVLPAFMAYYLREDAKGAKASNAVAAGRGFLASLGIVTVYGIIALVVFAVGFAAQTVVKWLPPIIGIVLIILAVLTVLPYQYHWLTRPFIELKRRIAARFGGTWEPGMGTKLFAFGMGYGAAGFACVAPPFIGAVLNASALGSTDQALVGLVLYVLIVIGLMVAITVALHVAGDRALQKVKVWSGVMKYVSAAALAVAGVYLLWLFLAAYVFIG